MWLLDELDFIRNANIAVLKRMLEKYLSEMDSKLQLAFHRYREIKVALV